ncbi:LIM homeobox transcription factor 1-beta [Scaptodrosophila lebanonensis]|uniref:LIM homeobox transcription factor 1-beta n=1 Tax=Drosophila lebanonensis TaxID=7225 RepID=A0A6J2UFA0_DROLE|nr:LIM homeobox transcription factor 1-beta [Scaptodrosophila lebanonensis]
MIDEQHPMQIGMFPMDIKCQQQQHTVAGAPTVAHNDKMATGSRNVNGSCNNHNNNSGNSNSNNNSNINGNNNTNTNKSNGNAQQTHACGPGPPMQNPHQHLHHQHQHQHHHQQQQQQQQPTQSQLCTRIALGECSLNGLATFSAPNTTTTHTPQAPQVPHMVVGMAPPPPPPPSLLLNQCAYCCQPICDRYIMRVVDNSFHEGCLKCATCSLHLVHTCYARDGKLYCRIDYERLYIRNRCLGCGHKIAADELVMRTHDNVFHLKCFACVVCGALLKKGEQYVVKQGQLFCRFDYEKEVEMLQGYDFYGDELFPPKLDGRRGPKRPRTILNTQQRRAFKASFEVSPKPCRKVRENLAKETGLSLRIVQVWFQNQRAKVKKIQKKAKQEPATKGVCDSQDSQESQDSSMTKIKDEAHSDSESQMESPFSIGSDGLAKLRCSIKDEQEHVPFSCMETNKENCNKNNEPILNTILGLSYATFQQLMGPFTQTPMINPIDRLYSMQSSYFRPEELGAYSECGGKDTMEH